MDAVYRDGSDVQWFLRNHYCRAQPLYVHVRTNASLKSPADTGGTARDEAMKLIDFSEAVSGRWPAPNQGVSTTGPTPDIDPLMAKVDSWSAKSSANQGGIQLHSQAGAMRSGQGRYRGKVPLPLTAQIVPQICMPEVNRNLLMTFVQAILPYTVRFGVTVSSRAILVDFGRILGPLRSVLQAGSPRFLQQRFISSFQICPGPWLHPYHCELYGSLTLGG